ncbi:MAG: hypothetical protein AAGH68_03045 [Pseudomonadota bacterium]
MTARPADHELPVQPHGAKTHSHGDRQCAEQKAQRQAQHEDDEIVEPNAYHERHIIDGTGDRDVTRRAHVTPLS